LPRYTRLLVESLPTAIGWADCQDFICAKVCRVGTTPCRYGWPLAGEYGLAVSACAGIAVVMTPARSARPAAAGRPTRAHLRDGKSLRGTCILVTSKVAW